MTSRHIKYVLQADTIYYVDLSYNDVELTDNNVDFSDKCIGYLLSKSVA